MSENPVEKVYGETEVRARLAAELAGWYYEDGTICRRYRTGGWRASLMVANAVGHLAELAWHHPDLIVSYPSVTVRLATHSAKGITDKDFSLARRIEQWIGWRPGADDPGLEGLPDEPHLLYVGAGDPPAAIGPDRAARSP
jgi:pterin-4a-carbinolamine dehydratase